MFPDTRASRIHSLDHLGELYWKPAYKYIRLQWRRSNDEAKDLVQGFFTAVIEQDILGSYDPGRAAFRTYLKACIDRYVMKQDAYASREKRGGSGRTMQLDFDAAEREIASATPTAEDVFLRECEREMFTRAIADLRLRCEVTGKSVLFRIFEQYDLAEANRPSYAELAAEHGLPVTTVTNHLAWCRRELRRLVAEAGC